MNAKRKITGVLLLVSLLLSAFAFSFALIGNAQQTAGSLDTIDVWLIGGQSNAVGYGEQNDTHKFPDKDNDDRYYTGFDNVLFYGEHEKFQYDVSGFTPVTFGFGQTLTRSGAELGVAKALGNTDKMNAVIKVAVGATEIYPKNNSDIAKSVGTWTPPSYYDPITNTGLANNDPNDEYPDVTEEVRNSYVTGDNSYKGEYIVGNMYRQFISVVRKGVCDLREMGYTPVLRGMWWMQGEAEAGTKVFADCYDELLECLINDVREEMTEIFGSDQSNMPFTAGNIYRNKRKDAEGNYIDSQPTYLHNINLAQVAVSERLDNVYYLHNGDDEEWNATIDGYTDLTEASGLGYYGQIDGWHFNAWTQQYFGEKFVEFSLSANSEHTVSAVGGDFTLENGGIHKKDASVTVSFMPDDGFKIDSVTMSVGGAAATAVTLSGGSYTFTMPDANVTFNVSTSLAGDGISTDYGVISAQYASKKAYPFALFKNGSFVSGYARWNQVLATLPVAESTDAYTILLRQDYKTFELDTNVTSVPSALGGTVTLDLGGNTMTRGSKYIFDIFHNSSSTYTTTINIKNGTLADINSSPIIGLNYGSGSANAAAKTYNFNFDGVTFVDLSARRTTGLVFDCWENGKGTANTGITVNAVFDDCVFDSSRANAPIAIGISGRGDNASDKTKVTLTVNGGSFIMNEGYTLVASSSEDTVKIGTGEDGKYPTVTLPAGVAPKYDGFSNAEGKLYALNANGGVTSGDNTVYSFEEAGVVTRFGTVSEEYRGAEYKFVVFKKDGTNVGYTTWIAAITAAREAVNGSNDKWAGIYLRSSYATDGNDKVANQLCHINGTVDIDLGGNTLSKGERTVFDVFSHTGSGGFETVINVSGGTIVGSPAIALDHGSGLTGEKTFKMTFERVNFRCDSAANPLALTLWTQAYNPSGSTKLELTYNGCEFDMTNAAEKAVFNASDVKDGRKSINVSIKVNGGAIKNMSTAAIATLDAGDTIAFGRYDGSYTSLSIATGTNPADIKTNFNDAEDKNGRVSLLKTVTADGGMDKYVFAASEKAGDYGFIPACYSNKDLYPFAFFKNGEFKDARANLTGYSGYGGSVAYLRKSIDNPVALKPFGINGVFTLDLGGNTLSRNSAYIFDVIANSTDLYDTTLVIKNGTLNSKQKWAIALNQTALKEKNKNMFFKFDNVTFKYESATAGNNTDGAFFNCWGDPGAEDEGHYGINANLTFDDCIFDFTVVPDNSTMFQFVGNDGKNGINEIDVVATFNGGTIKASNANANWKLFSAALSEAKNSADGTDTGNAVYLGKGKDGKLIKLQVINSTVTNQPAQTRVLTTTDGDYYFVGDSYDATNKHHIYQANTKLPYEVSDASGESLGKFGSWTYAVYTATTASASGGKATIKLLDNAKAISNGHFSTAVGEITVDLQGFTLTKESDPYLVNTYFQNTAATAVKIIFKNGTVKKSSATKFGIFCINYASGVNQNTEIATINFEFDNVDFVCDRADGAFIFSLFENGQNTQTAKGTYTEAVFNDCSFAYKGTVFALNNGSINKSVVKVTVNGGEFLPAAGAESVPFFTKDDKDSFTFGRLESGNYSTLVLPTGVAAPTTEYGGLKFVEKSVGDGTVTYILTPVAAVGIDFTPKASVTLDSNLIFNIYIPEDARLEAAYLNGELLTLGEAKDGYYLVSVELAADKAASTLTLKVTLDIDGTLVDGTYTFSTVKYAAKLLSMNSVDATEKTLIKDMLAYVKSAYEFFNAEDKATVSAEIDAVLNGYASTAAIDTANAKCEVNGLSGATFVLGANPAIRFYLDTYTADKFSFKVGERTLSASEANTGSDTYGDYIEFTLYAYEMTEVFSYEIADTEISGEYNLIAYYADALSKSDAELVDIVAKFYNYCASAKAYKG